MTVGGGGGGFGGGRGAGPAPAGAGGPGGPAARGGGPGAGGPGAAPALAGAPGPGTAGRGAPGGRAGGAGAPAQPPVVLSRNGKDFPVTGETNVPAGTEIKVTTERPSLSLSVKELDSQYVALRLPIVHLQCLVNRDPGEVAFCGVADSVPVF